MLVNTVSAHCSFNIKIIIPFRKKVSPKAFSAFGLNFYYVLMRECEICTKFFREHLRYEFRRVICCYGYNIHFFFDDKRIEK